MSSNTDNKLLRLTEIISRNQAVSRLTGTGLAIATLYKSIIKCTENIDDARELVNLLVTSDCFDLKSILVEPYYVVENMDMFICDGLHKRLAYDLFNLDYTYRQFRVYFDTIPDTQELACFIPIAYYEHSSEHELYDLTRPVYTEGKLTSGAFMFYKCKTPIMNVGSLNTRNMTSFAYMFAGVQTVELRGIHKFKTSKVTEMCGMFENFNSVANDTVINLNSYDLSHVATMQNMFYNAHFKTLMFTNYDINKAYTTEIKNLGKSHIERHFLNRTELKLTGVFGNITVDDLILGCLDFSEIPYYAVKYLFYEADIKTLSFQSITPFEGFTVGDTLFLLLRYMKNKPDVFINSKNTIIQ